VYNAVKLHHKIF